jgi:hypothetical protein
MHPKDSLSQNVSMFGDEVSYLICKEALFEQNLRYYEGMSPGRPSPQSRFIFDQMAPRRQEVAAGHI